MGAQPGTLNQKQTTQYAQNGQMIVQQQDKMLLLFYDVNSSQSQSYQSYRVDRLTTIGDILVYLQTKYGDFKLSIYFNETEFSLEKLGLEIYPYLSVLSQRKIGFKIDQKVKIRYRDLIKRNQLTAENSIKVQSESVTQPKAIPDNESQRQGQSVNFLGANNNQKQNNNNIKFLSVEPIQQKSNKQEEVKLIEFPPDIDNVSKPPQNSTESQQKSENLRMQLKIKQLEQFQVKLEQENQNLKQEIKTLQDQIQQYKLTQNQKFIKTDQPQQEKIPQKVERQILVSSVDVFKCHQILTVEELQNILTQSINLGKPAVWNHSINIPRSLLQKAGDVGKVYVNQICSNELTQISQSFQNSQISIGRCSSQLCSFFCIWDENCRTFSLSDTTYCPSCLVQSVRKVIIK